MEYTFNKMQKSCFSEERLSEIMDTRTIEFVASAQTRDRHGTVIPVDKWRLDGFLKNPVIGYQHDTYGNSAYRHPDPDSVIGIATSLWKDEAAKRLMVKIKFEPADINPLAEKIFKKVLFGSVRAGSVKKSFSVHYGLLV